MSEPLVLFPTELGPLEPAIGVIFPPEVAKIKSLIERFDGLYLAGEIGGKPFMTELVFEHEGKRLTKTSELFPSKNSGACEAAVDELRNAIVGKDAMFNEKGKFASLSKPSRKKAPDNTPSKKWTAAVAAR